MDLGLKFKKSESHGSGSSAHVQTNSATLLPRVSLTLMGPTVMSP